MPMEIDPIRHRSGSIFVPEKELQKELNKSNRNNAILRTIPTVATRDSKYKVANSEKCCFLPHFREPFSSHKINFHSIVKAKNFTISLLLSARSRIYLHLLVVVVIVIRSQKKPLQ